MTTRDRDYQLMMNALADVTRRRDAELDNGGTGLSGEHRASGRRAGPGRGRGGRRRTAGRARRPRRCSMWTGRPRGCGSSCAGRAACGCGRWASCPSRPRSRRCRGSRCSASPTTAPTTGRESARALLARAAERIDDTVRPASRRALPRWVLPLLPFLGALIAGATGLIAAGLVTFGGADVPGGTRDPRSRMARVPGRPVGRCPGGGRPGPPPAAGPAGHRRHRADPAGRHDRRRRCSP